MADALAGAARRAARPLRGWQLAYAASIGHLVDVVALAEVLRQLGEGGRLLVEDCPADPSPLLALYSSPRGHR